MGEPAYRAQQASGCDLPPAGGVDRTDLDFAAAASREAGGEGNLGRLARIDKTICFAGWHRAIFDRDWPTAKASKPYGCRRATAGRRGWNRGWRCPPTVPARLGARHHLRFEPGGLRGRLPVLPDRVAGREAESDRRRNCGPGGCGAHGIRRFRRRRIGSISFSWEWANRS